MFLMAVLSQHDLEENISLSSAEVQELSVSVFAVLDMHSCSRRKRLLREVVDVG